MVRRKSADPLATYNRKRDFTKTAEPRGGFDKLPWGHGNGFMVQKHDATRLHYDFRLELDGTLKSWAVPNGPSLDPNDKRLAVRTEDHPLSYATFEGLIPKGEYGGGTVMLWDRGTWTPDPRKDPRKTLAEGHLHFTLDGERMNGEWVMFRLKPRGKERTENWILRKVDDAQSGSSTGLTDKYLTSIKTGRTMQEIAAGRKAKELAGWKNPPRYGEGDRAKRGGGASSAFHQDELENALEILHDVSGIEPDDANSALAQPGVAASIARRIVAHVMGQAIRFDTELGSRTIEIQHERPDGMLSPKFEFLRMISKNIP